MQTVFLSLPLHGGILCLPGPWEWWFRTPALVAGGFCLVWEEGLCMALGFTPASHWGVSPSPPCSRLFTAHGGAPGEELVWVGTPLVWAKGELSSCPLRAVHPFQPHYALLQVQGKRFPRDFRKPFCVEIESVLAASRFQGNTIDHKRKPKASFNSIIKK